jgi:hypothetical protein
MEEDITEDEATTDDEDIDLELANDNGSDTDGP